MKRLTISMSDALFDKLNQVENKSLFIRKLIEGELRKGIAYSSDAAYESLAGDIEDLHHELRSLSSRLVYIENQIADAKTDPFLTKDHLESDQTANYQISSLPSSENGIETPIIQTAVADSYSITNGLNEFADKDQGSVSDNISDIQVNLSAQDSDKVLPIHSDEMHNMPFRSVVNVGIHKEPVCPITETNETPVNSMIITPEIANQSQESSSARVNNPSTPSFIMPELSDISTPSPTPFVATALEHSAPSTPSLVMPELGAMEHPSPSPFEMPHGMSVPYSGNDLQMPSFSAEGPAPSGLQMQPPSIMMPEMQPRSSFEAVGVQSHIQHNAVPPANTGSMSMNERLQGNILMYLPHGARIKRSIIKGLVSKKFSAEEIDAQINLMISGHSLQVEVEDGVEYLLRP